MIFKSIKYFIFCFSLLGIVKVFPMIDSDECSGSTVAYDLNAAEGMRAILDQYERNQGAFFESIKPKLISVLEDEILQFKLSITRMQGEVEYRHSRLNGIARNYKKVVSGLEESINILEDIDKEKYTDDLKRMRGAKENYERIAIQSEKRVTNEKKALTQVDKDFNDEIDRLTEQRESLGGRLQKIREGKVPGFSTIIILLHEWHAVKCEETAL